MYLYSCLLVVSVHMFLFIGDLHVVFVYCLLLACMHLCFCLLVACMHLFLFTASVYTFVSVYWWLVCLCFCLLVAYLPFFLFICGLYVPVFICSQERTKNAQFIIISLRNNMFELADRLVGIYKTYDATKSVTLNPWKLSQDFGTRIREIHNIDITDT